MEGEGETEADPGGTGGGVVSAEEDEEGETRDEDGYVCGVGLEFGGAMMMLSVVSVAVSAAGVGDVAGFAKGRRSSSSDMQSGDILE
eukprot:CAMPEP_0178576504 /NCGR_PEP_ID=MMETSP0697-20121206/20493_1 /TAXON_ID=265572 /ORGANISM="Extubocellulus spinifer, Strain CCMP396" /LENGTH=86 /DNA_ID=CAMNT_0020211707 /DNA_START=289 /DNA_END=550 /DNA_ORIENTATION=+